MSDRLKKNGIRSKFKTNPAQFSAWGQPSRRREFAGKSVDFYPIHDPAYQPAKTGDDAQKRNPATTGQNAHDQAERFTRLGFFGHAPLLELGPQRFGDIDDHKKSPDDVEQGYEHE